MIEKKRTKGKKYITKTKSDSDHLPSSLVIFGLYHKRDVSCTNLGVCGKISGFPSIERQLTHDNTNTTTSTLTLLQ